MYSTLDIESLWLELQPALVYEHMPQLHHVIHHSPNIIRAGGNPLS